ncbi:MAG: hypothetical protein DWQ07_10465 [Chloroflexi bacterium]|nr:MAG: hypothetical protein DWQ07_10465 [Chloroflexota bacterium]MBL1192865.1 hypothetical protein [Chloroflexota bacterium]NOH10158.1 hypothetical protein [Chloroflexota bacterium]
MQTRKIDTLTLHYDASQQQAADLATSSLEQSINMIAEQWQLKVPDDCHCYIMTQWPRFLFQSAPLSRKLLFPVLLPLYALSIPKQWPQIGGWHVQYGSRHVVGVKPPAMLDLEQQSIGREIFVPEERSEEKFKQVICHELTHACSAQLQLPAWLYEGLAMLSVEKQFNKQTVKRASIGLLSNPNDENDATRVMLQTYVRGYWLARYLDEEHPDLLRSFLKNPMQQDELENEIAGVLNIDHTKPFWEEADKLLAAHYQTN